MIKPTAEPFYYPGNTTGCLLIHGFTGAPTEMKPLGKYLQKNGYTVLGVRLFGHGTQIQDLKRANYMDWIHSVQDGWHLLKNHVEKIYLIGLSMGGVLALYNAARLPAAGVVSMSTPYELGPDPRLPILPFLAPIMPYIEKGPPDWQDPDADQNHFSYQKYATRSIYQLNLLLQEMRQSLADVTIPALMIHSRKDSSVPHQQLKTIYEEVGTPPDQKNTLLLNNSGHVVTRDADKTIVFQAIKRFLQGR